MAPMRETANVTKYEVCRGMKELADLGTPTRTRTTLKLKTPAKKPSIAPPAPPKIPRVAKTADWADKHKQRMQADMDALGLGNVLVE